MVRDTCPDVDVGQKLITTDAPPLPLSPRFKGKEWSRLIWP